MAVNFCMLFPKLVKKRSGESTNTCSLPCEISQYLKWKNILAFLERGKKKSQNKRNWKMNDFSAQCKPMASKDIFRHRLLRKLIPCELFLKGSHKSIQPQKWKSRRGTKLSEAIMNRKTNGRKAKKISLWNSVMIKDLSQKVTPK